MPWKALLEWKLYQEKNLRKARPIRRTCTKKRKAISLAQVDLNNPRFFYSRLGELELLGVNPKGRVFGDFA